MSILSKIRKYSISGTLLSHSIKKLDYAFALLARRIAYSHGKIDNNKLFVMTYDDCYACNPQYIVEEIIRQQLPIDIVWATSKKSKMDRFPPEVRTVKRRSFSMFEEQATAKVWLDNALCCVWEGMPKKKDQVYINTWHGSLGIKKLSGNVVWMHRAKRCKRITDYCISNSQFEETVYKTTFWPRTKLLRYGHARNDILFKTDFHQHLRERICEFFEISPEKKILLYAPTFRDDGNTDCFDINFDTVKESLQTRFGGEWVILLRLHHKNRTKKLNMQFNDCIKDAGSYPDMQELLATVDVGITDYSSWAYDYILTKRPLFIYATDIDEYNDRRGFYYPLEETPFPIATNNEELVHNILNFDNKTYLKDVETFLEGKECMEDGHASERIAKLIAQLTEMKV